MAFEKNMGESSNLKHLNLDANSKPIPRTISDILNNELLVSDGSKKPSELDSQIHSYEDELRKVAAFKRELPLCMQLLKDGIEKLNEENLQWEWENRETEPIVTLPINTEDDMLGNMSIDDFDYNAKRTWVSTFQLRTVSIEYDPHPLPKFTGKGGAFNPYKKKPTTNIMDCDDDDDEAEEINRGVLFRPQPHPIQKKKQSRRCWSPELHDLFVDALDKLGGPEVATPKRILENMKVEGLTSDEVKSHLQKYRIHNRRITSSAGLANGDNNMQEKEFGEPDCKGKRVYRGFQKRIN